MSEASSSNQALRQQLEDLQARLQEAESTLKAIYHHEIDALVVRGPSGNQIYTLTGAEYPYRVLVETMNEGAVTLGSDGSILYCNRRFTRLLRAPLEQILGAPIGRFVAPNDLPVLAQLLERAKSKPKGELILQTIDGALVPTYFSLSSLELEGQQGICIVVTDLTEQKRNAEIVKAERLARAILEQVMEAVVVCDTEGRITHASRKANELAGAPLLGSPFAEVLPLGLVSGDPLPWQTGDSSNSTGEFHARHSFWKPDQRSVHSEVTLTRSDGQVYYLILNSGPLYGDGSAMLGFVVTLTDISERKRAEDELREADRLKDEFLAMLAHELRNPLAPLRNAAQLLRLVDPSAPPKLSWAQEIIDRQVNHLTKLVDDLLDVSRISRGQIILAKEPLDLATLVHHAVEASRPLIEARRHSFEIELPPTPVRLQGDLIRLSQALTNLLNNAAKYTHEGGRIWLEAESTEDKVIIRVRDSGMGIPATLLPHIFDLFTQAERTLDRSQGGLGLGLTLVRRLVELHNGKVEARSAGVNRGAEFIMELPLLLADPPAGLAADGDANQEHPACQGGLRVLVVDDNIDVADSLAMLLQLQGHEVHTAYTGKTALEMALTLRPHAILLDIGLPGIDGYEVARRLRAQAEFQETLLIALTGYGQERDRARSKAAGFDHHLIKPVDPEALLALLGSPATKAVVDGKTGRLG